MILQYENFGKTKTSSIDIDVRGRVKFDGAGVLGLRALATYALSRREWDIDANAYRPNRVGLRNTPQIRAVFSGSWADGPWTTSARFNYTSATDLNNDETDVGTWSPTACAKRFPTSGDLSCFLKADWTTTVGVSYTGIKNLKLAGSITNPFGCNPPVNLRDGATLRPRLLKLGAEYSF